MPIDNSDIVARLREVMRLKKINQKDLASIVGVSERTISRWMCGESDPLDKNLRKISIALDINLDWLITGNGSIQSSRRGAIAEIPGAYLRPLLELDPEVVDIEAHGKEQCPVVRAYDNLTTHLKFYCIHCREWHLHGRGGREEPYHKGRGGFAGHRHTHCLVTNSPFQKEGVILEIVGKFTDKIKKKYKKGKPLFCPKCRSYYSSAFNACECGFINKKRKAEYPEIAQCYQKLLTREAEPDDEITVFGVDEASATQSVVDARKMREKLTKDSKVKATIEPGPTRKKILVSQAEEMAVVSQEDIKISTLLTMTAMVLESDTPYSPALSANIKAFSTAVENESELAKMKQDNLAIRNSMAKVEERMAEIEKRIGSNQEATG